MFSELNGGAERAGGDRMRMVDALARVLAGWRTVLLVSLVAGALALALSLLKDRNYAARTLLIAAQGGSDLQSQLLSARLPAGIPAVFAGGGNRNQQLMGVILKSRALSDSAVRRLAGGHGRAGEAKAYAIRQALAYGTEVHSNLDGSIRIEIQAADPELALELARVMPDLANTIMAGLSAEGAQRKQQFLESQLATATQRLQETEQALVRFQRERGSPDLPEQARQTVEAAADLQQEILKREIEVAQLRRVMTPDNSELANAEAALRAARAQLRRLGTSSPDAGDVFVGMREAPQLRAEATRLLRQYTRDEQIVISLTAGLADAQLDARNTLPTVTVLDAARVSDDPVGPGPITYTAGGLLLGLLAGVLLVLGRELSARARRDPANEPFFTEWDRVMRIRLSGRA